MLDSLPTWIATSLTGDGILPSEADIREMGSRIGQQLPDELRLLLITANQPEGFVGNSYVAFFDVEEIVGCWLQAKESVHDFVPFASNGSGEWYGLDYRSASARFVLMPSIGIAWDAAIFIGATWDEFWESLQKGSLFGTE
ncbi:MAG: SMI1/KNR4 family protein [Acidobacteriota bacterium]